MEEKISTIPKINWLASYPKSGNTWVRCLLHAYIYGSIDFSSFYGITISDLNAGAWFAASPYPWGMLTAEEKLLVRYSALMIMASVTSGGRSDRIIKTHCGNYRINSVDLIPSQLTRSAVYIVRDPRDVLISYSKHMGISIDKAIEDMSEERLSLDFEGTGILQPMGSWKHHVMSWYVEGTIFPKIIIKYEDLLEDTEKEFRKILEIYFPDSKIDEEKVKLAIELSKFDNLKKQEEDKGFPEATKNTKFFTTGRSSWREILTKEQIQKIEEYNKEAMQRAGYELYS